MRGRWPLNNGQKIPITGRVNTLDRTACMASMLCARVAMLLTMVVA